MKNVLVIIMLATVVTFAGGCAAKAQSPAVSDEVVMKEKTSSVTEDVLADAENLYAFQENYANGINALIEIPYVMVESVYDNYDALLALKNEYAPVLLREYALTNMVYFDYDSGYSICWDKNENVVNIEETDIEERESFKEKQHR